MCVCSKQLIVPSLLLKTKKTNSFLDRRKPNAVYMSKVILEIFCKKIERTTLALLLFPFLGTLFSLHNDDDDDESFDTRDKQIMKGENKFLVLSFQKIKCKIVSTPAQLWKNRHLPIFLKLINESIAPKEGISSQLNGENRTKQKYS